ncbi:MAG: YitT family protein [Bullifex sp.]
MTEEKRIDRLYVRRIAVMTCGIFILSAGIVLFKLSLMGNDPSTAMVIAIGNQVGVDFSIILLGMNLLWFLSEWHWSRNLVGIGTFVNWFLVGPLASLYEKLIRSFWQVPDDLPSRLILMILGVFVLSFSCALYQTSDLGIAPYDALSITLSEKTGKKYFLCRIFTDSVCVLIAFLFRGIIGLGTLVCALGLGPFIQFFTGHAAKPLLFGRTSSV